MVYKAHWHAIYGGSGDIELLKIRPSDIESESNFSRILFIQVLA